MLHRKMGVVNAELLRSVVLQSQLLDRMLSTKATRRPSNHLLLSPPSFLIPSFCSRLGPLPSAFRHRHVQPVMARRQEATQPAHRNQLRPLRLLHPFCLLLHRTPLLLFRSCHQLCRSNRPLHLPSLRKRMVKPILQAVVSLLCNLCPLPMFPNKPLYRLYRNLGPQRQARGRGPHHRRPSGRKLGDLGRPPRQSPLHKT
mmetsp:Transcript_64286/g.172059  ORF Transcript_64286/g.172059 Transcript_64286/m.172059 type:complete len:200 (+) Transcript_64286:1240-1839(+)